MKLLAAVVLVLVVGLAQYAWFQAPCGLWTYSKAGEVPARCVMQR